MNIYQTLEHFKNSHSQNLFGDELESIQATLDKSDATQMPTQPPFLKNNQWIKIQMAQSHEEIRALVQ